MGKKILIIDDDKKWRTRLKLILEEEGYAVSTVSNFAGARDVLGSRTFDLVTVDICLSKPGDDGAGIEIGPEWEMLLDLIGRSRGLIISGYATPKRVRDAFKRHRVVDFIEKKRFNLREFRETVRKVLNQEAKPPGTKSPGAKPMNAGEERTWLERELGILKRNLYRLRAQRATYAPGEVPLHLFNQIDELEQEINCLEARVRELAGSSQ
jgi:DNA-binding NtrC family response regulator